MRLGILMRLAGVLLLSAFAMLAVVSCGSGGDDVSTTPQPVPVGPDGPDGPDNNVAILFSASHEANTDVTRAELPLESKVKSFIVYGYKNKGIEYSDVQTVFPGYIVNWSKNSENSTTTNSDGWEYVDQQSNANDPEQTIKYWDMSATAYRFFGVAKGEGEYEAHEITDGGQPKYTISFKLDATTEAGVNAAPYFSELWFSTNNYDEYPDREFGKPVKLLFLQPFARVRFMFTQSDPNAVLLLEVKSFGPTDNTKTIVNQCRLTVTYPLKGTDKKESYGRTDVKGYEYFTEDYSDTNKRWYNVYAPQDLGEFKLSVKVNNELKEVVVPAQYMKWLPGYQYTYVFKITDQGGVEIDLVQSGFSKWKEMTGSSTFHNW